MLNYVPKMKNGHPPSEHFHAVRFYDGSDSLCRIVGQFLGEGLAQGHPVLVIATPDHSSRIEDCLTAAGFDVPSLKRLGDIVTLDAHETLGQFMVGAMPDAALFQQAVGELIAQVRREHGSVSIRAYGEMVNVLWKVGLEDAAIRLEMLWNQLAKTHEFSLLCGYSMGNFYKDAAVDDIKRQHSHLVSEEGQTRPLAS